MMLEAQTCYLIFSQSRSASSQPHYTSIEKRTPRQYLAVTSHQNRIIPVIDFRSFAFCAGTAREPPAQMSVGGVWRFCNSSDMDGSQGVWVKIGPGSSELDAHNASTSIDQSYFFVTEAVLCIGDMCAEVSVLHVEHLVFWAGGKMPRS